MKFKASLGLLFSELSNYLLEFAFYLSPFHIKYLWILKRLSQLHLVIHSSTFISENAIMKGQKVYIWRQICQYSACDEDAFSSVFSLLCALALASPTFPHVQLLIV